MTGEVNVDREAIVLVRIRGREDREVEIQAVLNTGFTGFLTLPLHLIETLSLLLQGSRLATLADGKTLALDIYRATAVWNGQLRDIQILAAEGAPLLGMSMLYGSRLTMEVIDGGGVSIEPLG